MKPHSPHVLAFDFGGSHVASAVIRNVYLDVSNIKAHPISINSNAVTILRAFEECGSAALRAAKLHSRDLAGISVAAPRPFDYTTGTSLMQHKHFSLYGTCMRTRLAKMFAISEDAITFINDADAFLLGEIISERGAEVHRTVGVTLGTGIGSAFAKGKTILEFGRGIPPNGEIYNLYWKGRTVEHYLSAHAIVRSYREAGGHAETVAAIAGRARQEPLAEDVMRKFGETLGQALDEILVEFQPEVMILGGAIAKSGDLFLPALEHALSRIRPVIRLSTLFDAAALLGAAEHWSLLQGAHQ